MVRRVVPGCLPWTFGLSRVPARLVGSVARGGTAALFRRRPARKQTERLCRPRAGLGGVGDDHQAGVGADLQPVEAELELADDRMVEALDALAAQAHVVRGPEPAELLASGGELA